MQHVGAVLSLLFLFSHPALGTTGPDIDSLLRRIFPETSRIEEKTLWLDAAAREHVSKAGRTSFDEDHLSYRIISGKAGPAGYAFVDDVKGLHEMITYLTALNADGSVRAIEILAYREAYGFEIKHDRFRRQFTGKTLKDPIRVGTDIRNIAGATISTNAISAGVRRILAVYEAAIGAKGPSKGGIRRSIDVWGTTLSIEVVSDTPESAGRAIEEAFREVERLTPIFSRWDSGSEISRVNAQAGGSSVEVSADFYDLARLALDMFAATQGRFDPTKKAGGRKVLDLDNLKGREAGERYRVRLEKGHSLDFDGIVKGYAADRMTDILKKRGFRRWLINFGESSIAAMGEGSGGAWEIWVRDARMPGTVADTPLVRLVLRDAVLSVSGTYERGPHILDPFTGKPAVGTLQAIVVGPLKPNASAKADALTKAVFVAGMEGLDKVQLAGFEGARLGEKGLARSAGFSTYEVVK